MPGGGAGREPGWLVWGRRRKRHCRELRALGWRVRTSNICIMLVTPEVSQLEMSALKLARPLKSPLMSVMPETSQLLMGPYSNSAAVTFALYSPTAVCSLNLLAKVLQSRRRWLVGGPGVLVARSTSSHCAGGTATGWLVCASLLATLDFVCGRKAVRKAAATPMSTSTRKLEASFLSYRLRWGGRDFRGQY